MVLYFTPSPPHPLPTHPRHPADRPRGGVGGGHGGTEVFLFGATSDVRAYPVWGRRRGGKAYGGAKFVADTSGPTRGTGNMNRVTTGGARGPGPGIGVRGPGPGPATFCNYSVLPMCFALQAPKPRRGQHPRAILRRLFPGTVSEHVAPPCPASAMGEHFRMQPFGLRIGPRGGYLAFPSVVILVINIDTRRQHYKHFCFSSLVM